MPVGATGPSVAAVDLQQAPAVDTQPSDSTTKCDSVKAGICVPSEPPTTHPVNTHKSWDRDFVALTIINKVTNSEDRMDSYARLDELYGKQDPEIRQAMLANPKFAKIVDGAAQALISTCLKKGPSGDSIDTGDLALHYLHGLAEGSNPELAAALVVSATRTFVENGVIFTHNDKMLTSNRTYIDDLRRLIGQSNSAASEAIKVLESRAVRKP